MDIDRFIATNHPAWDRLAVLSAQGRRRGGLSADEVDELVRLYQRVSTHLSQSRTSFADPGLVARLSALVATAGQAIYGTRPRTLRSFGRFFTHTFPAALWHARRAVLVSALLTFVPAIALGTWLGTSPRALDTAAPAALRQAYIDEESNHYYTDQPSVQFASEVYTNNVRVAVLAFAGGILLCGLTVWVLTQNGASLGLVAGFFLGAGKFPLLLGLIVPHGLIELTSVVVAGGAGLRLGWTVIAPGDRTRFDALAEEGKRSVVLVFGCVFTLLVAGIIEGFVTGSALPTFVRVGLGVAVEIAFLAYAWSFGRRAASQGLTGAFGEQERGWTASRA